MQYALLYYEAPAEAAKRHDADASPHYWAAWRHYMQVLSESGAMQGGRGLEPAHTATRLRGSDTGRIVEDGPFSEAREELGGFVIVEADGIDDALALAEKAPCAAPGAGHVEVRPVLPAPSDHA